MQSNNPTLSFSTGKIAEDFQLINWVDELKKLSTDAIELGFVRAERIPLEITEDLVASLKSFDKVFMHAPAKVNGEWIRYPSVEIESSLNRMTELVEKVPNIENILFHPDLVDDFSYLEDLFGNKTSFENMDSKKSFGTTLEDMESIFSKAPKAKWVCDINHLYTVDKSMELAKSFHESFSDRLAYYHVSALGAFHEMFVNNLNETVILKGVLYPEKPLIHEGFSTKDDIQYLVKEKQLIEKLLIKNN